MGNKSEIASPWYKFGTDKQYQDWCRKQPSAYSGEVMNVIYAHYRTAANSGIGIKPVYSGLPLTWAEHTKQHQIGQYSFMPKEWWETEIEKHLTLWSKS